MPSSSPRTAPTVHGKDGTPTTILVKDLDAKIEVLRAREEEVRRINAERTRIEEYERISAELRRKEEVERINAERTKIEEEERMIAAEFRRKEEVERIHAERTKIEDEERTMAAELKREEEARWVRERVELEESRRMAAEKEEEEVTRKRTKVELEARVSREDNIAWARQQPKSTEEERRLQEMYGNIEDLEERAFNILVDLGMVDLHSDPDDMALDSEEDD
ncbi:hypothetical protein ACHAXA_006122 [Cyclostephanos tholiformis]|uniref:Uncharacterized protein n=1 Tax=Cyclostephanos tholiformis TaxID=382380 RepID=A0ABD3RCA5_9STRA